MTIISINIANILIQYFGEKVSQIEEAAAKQNESNTKMVAIADNISDEFEKAMTMLNELEKSIDISHSSGGYRRQHGKYGRGNPETGGYVF